MDDLAILRMVDLAAGIIGALVAVGLMFFPRAVESIEKKLDSEIPTHNIEDLLNRKRELSAFLLRRSRMFGIILLIISFFLLMTGIILI